MIGSSVNRNAYGRLENAGRFGDSADGQKKEIEMLTVAKVQDGQLIEERLYFDNLSVMKQLGLA